MSTRSYLLLNQESGSARRDQTLEARTIAAARAHDAAVEVVRVNGADIGAHARRAAAAGAVLVLVSGGDGTLGAVAQELAGTGAVLGVVPTGTFNHFARDIGLAPAEIETAVDVAYRGRTVRIDLGRAGPRRFLNNCSIGVYPRFVEERKLAEPEVGRFFAWTTALGMIWEEFPVERVRVSADGGPPCDLDTPLLFVGNNPYQVQLPEAGRRRSLDRGVLWVCVARAGTQLELLAQTITTWVLGTGEAEGMDAFEARRLRLESPLGSPNIRIALDGEPTTLDLPLEIATDPGALLVRVR